MSAADQCEWQRRWPIGAGLGPRRAAGQDGGARGGLRVQATEERTPPSESNSPPSRTRRRRRKLKGEASAERQLGFMEQLLDVIRYLDAISGTCSGDSTTSSLEESLRGAARKNEEFLREVFSSPSLPALLAPALPPCTADIKPLLLEEPAPRVRTRLSVRSSGKTLAELARTLEEANTALEQLRAESSSLRGGRGAPEPRHGPADPGAGGLRLAPADGGLRAGVRDGAAGTLRPRAPPHGSAPAGPWPSTCSVDSPSAPRSCRGWPSWATPRSRWCGRRSGDAARAAAPQRRCP
ncbi:HAUS augmin-like complex subunit 7 isoform X2 [Eretmochelys imbricata]